MASVITVTTYGSEPARWNRCEWEFTGPGRKEIRYEADVDLTTVLRNIALAGALVAEYMRGISDGKEVSRG